MCIWAVVAAFLLLELHRVERARIGKDGTSRRATCHHDQLSDRWRHWRGARCMARKRRFCWPTRVSICRHVGESTRRAHGEHELRAWLQIGRTPNAPAPTVIAQPKAPAKAPPTVETDPIRCSIHRDTGGKWEVHPRDQHGVGLSSAAVSVGAQQRYAWRYDYRPALGHASASRHAVD